MQWPLSDLSLSRRLERCEARANVAFVEARAQLSPEIGATWMERAGAFAMFDGVGSPVTQTFGLDMFETATPADLEALEDFFTSRGAGVFHEVSPIAGLDLVKLLTERGYTVAEMTSVMFQPLVFTPASLSELQTRVASAKEAEAWSDVAAEGWSELTEYAPIMRALARVSARAFIPFYAELDGKPVATGALAMHDGVALLAGASTIPSARNRGAQRALLEARLRFAAERGCDLAMMCAAPGSGSQRNAERQGFRIGYTRVKWGK